MKSIPLILLTTFSVTAFSQSFNNSVGKFNITQPSYDIVINETIGSNLKLGDGINMADRYNPEGTSLKAFSSSSLSNVSIEEDKIKSTNVEYSNIKSRIIETQTTKQLAEMLNLYFKGSYGLANMSAAYNRAKTLDASSKSIFVVIEKVEYGPSISIGNFVWNREPLSESPQILTDDKRLSQFLNDYGSHYIQSLNYGARIVIHAKLNSKKETDVISFRAEMKASFGSGSVGGSVSTSSSKILTSGKVEIVSEVTAGKITPNEYQTVMNTYGQVAEFINGMRDGSITVGVTPITAKVKSYWHTLIDYPKTRALLSPFSGYKIESPFGIPKGTIIAWSPNSAINRDTDLNSIIPDGWAVCDGTFDTPNLTDKFIMGTANLEEVGTEGGKTKHSHSSVMGHSNHNIRRGGGGNSVAENDHKHSLTINESENIPPYYKLIYLIKL